MVVGVIVVIVMAILAVYLVAAPTVESPSTISQTTTTSVQPYDLYQSIWNYAQVTPHFMNPAFAGTTFSDSLSYTSIICPSSSSDAYSCGLGGYGSPIPIQALSATSSADLSIVPLVFVSVSPNEGNLRGEIQVWYEVGPLQSDLISFYNATSSYLAKIANSIAKSGGQVGSPYSVYVIKTSCPCNALEKNFLQGFDGFRDVAGVGFSFSISGFGAQNGNSWVYNFYNLPFTIGIDLTHKKPYVFGGVEVHGPNFWLDFLGHYDDARSDIVWAHPYSSQTDWVYNLRSITTSLTTALLDEEPPPSVVGLVAGLDFRLLLHTFVRQQ